MSRISIWASLVSLILFWSVGLSWASHFHFAEYSTEDVWFGGTSGFTTYTWTFDLETDNLYLWPIPDSSVQNCTNNYLNITQGSNEEDIVSITPGYFLGHMSVNDLLHHAYLTMRFDEVNDHCCNGGCSGQGEFILSLDGDKTTYPLEQGNIFNNLEVTSYMIDDHRLLVSILLDDDNHSCCTGGGCNGGCCCCDNISFKVDWIKLSGCFEAVPEPSSVLLASVALGVLSLAGLLNKKKL